MAELGIEFISVFGLPPVAFIELAAELGFKHVSLGLPAMAYNPHGYAAYSLRDDAGLRREVKSALAANGVSFASGENLGVYPGVTQAGWLADLEVLAQMGAKRINSISTEPDLARNIEQYGRLSELASSFGIATMLEFAPCFAVGDLPTAVEIARQVGRADFGLVIDTMHVGRSGATAAELAALDPGMVRYIQICDVPMPAKNPDYIDEAMHERMIPGEGDLPLAAYLAALPRDEIISLEVPLRPLAEAGIGPKERLQRCRAATLQILSTFNFAPETS